MLARSTLGHAACMLVPLPAWGSFKIEPLEICVDGLNSPNPYFAGCRHLSPMPLLKYLQIKRTIGIFAGGDGILPLLLKQK